MRDLLLCELWLTVDVVAGMTLAGGFLRLGLHDRILRPVMSMLSIPPVTVLAVTVSVASSRAGAAVISGSLSRGEITERCALWSVMAVSFPAYLRRWPVTLMLSVSLAGIAGGIFAATLLVRSAVRFAVALWMVRGEVSADAGCCAPVTAPKMSRSLLRTLPVAWVMFALTYSIVPAMNEYLSSSLSEWGVAAASIGHITAALSLAGGALKSGQLNAAGAVFALVLGSGIGTLTRVLRQNAGYYYGLFPKSTATKMLLLNLATILPLVMMNLLFAGLAVLLCS